MKTIIEYISGCKGDMLVRFLNNMLSDQNSTGKSGRMPISCTNWLKLINPNELTLDRFEEVLERNQFKFLSSHPLWVLYNKDYRDLLKKHNYEIWSIKFEPKHYVTIQIESLLKNLFHDHQKRDKNVQLTDILNVLFFEKKQIPEWIKNTISENDVNLEDLDFWNWQNIRTKRMRNILKNTTSHLYEMRACTHRLFNEMIEDRTLLHYEHLYLQEYPFPYMPNREKEWYGLLKNSWCDYEGEDYRKFDDPNDWDFFLQERRNHVYAQTVMEYLEQWKK